ncbi:DUF302 domain-containing protein [Halomicrococcus sp. NG-SE-24]|uniref:DUF302 domain-containing protein n=1 Tax=Halomicrococcus sp. NG-SE-24 TaxID=3436928 RepID=UPI003D97648A
MSENSPDRRRRQLMKAAGLLAGVGSSAAVATGSSDADESTTANETPTTTENSGDYCLPENPGLVTVESDQSFDDTVTAIKQRIEASPLTLMTTVDHAANADSADLDLPPTTLLIFGNPEIGTQLMQASRTVAIDLPQKMLVWAEEETVHVTYNDPQYLAARHDIEGKDDLLQQVSMALESLATGSGSEDEDGASKSKQEC